LHSHVGFQGEAAKAEAALTSSTTAAKVSAQAARRDEDERDMGARLIAGHAARRSARISP
jgi:hypothetical protein